MKLEDAKINLDINFVLAMVKCLSEQLHTMQWSHSHQVKQKFNRLLKVAKIYENEIDKSMHESDDQTVENIYDALMDSICASKEIAIQEFKKENNYE